MDTQTQEELETWYIKQETAWKQSQRTPQLAELINIFPEALDYLKIHLEDLKQQLASLYEYKKNLYAVIESPENLYFQKNWWFWYLVADHLFLSSLSSLEKETNQLSKILAWHSKPQSADEITEQDIEHAKQIPISSLLEFNRAEFARCLWHEDKTPSLKLYKNKNRVHCFSCDKNEDTIGIIQQLHHTDFISAVRFLIKK